MISLLRSLGYEVVGLLDDDSRRWNQWVDGVPIIGSVQRLAHLEPRPTLIAVGDNAARRRLALQNPCDWIVGVHPSAIVDPSAQLGAGSIVMAGAIVQANAVVGDHVIINTGATIDHDCVIGDFAHIAPGVRLAGEVTIGAGVLMGIGAIAIPGITVGTDATIGAGSVLVRDVPPNVVALGVPARTQACRRAAG